MSALRNSLEKQLSIPFYIFLAILFLLPIPLGANRPWAWSFFELAIFALTIYTTFRLRTTKHIGIHPYISMVLLWLAFIAIASFQVVPLPAAVVDLLSPSSSELYRLAGAETYYISVNQGQSTINLIKLFSLFCLLILTLQLINSESRIRLLLITMLASGAFQALYGTLEVALSPSQSMIFGLEVSDKATGSFVYHNHYANFLMLCLSAGVGLIVSALEKDKSLSRKNNRDSLWDTLLNDKIIIRVCVGLIIIALFMSRSLIGNTAAFASAAIIGLLALLLIRNRSTGLFIFVVGTFIFNLFIVSAYFGLARIKERLEQTSLATESSDEVILDAFPIIQDFPLFGSGGGSFYSIFPSYQALERYSFYDHAHNDFLQFAIEFGIVGVFILLVILLFTFYKALRAMYRRKNSIFKGTSFSVAMALLGMCINMSVDFPLQAFANACYFVIFIGLAMIANSLKVKRAKPISRRRRVSA